MSAISESVKTLMNANGATLHRTVSEITQAVIAERAGLSPSLVSRLLSGKDSEDEAGGALIRIMTILASCNLVVVPRSHKTVDPDEYRAMQILASKRLDDVAPSCWSGIE